MIQVFVFVPVEHSEIVKNAMFMAGGGKLGNYDCCCFEQAGIGQFRPLKGSQAYLGRVGEIEQVSEIKIEMICEDQFFSDVVKSMKEVHPYETPAFYAIKILDNP